VAHFIGLHALQVVPLAGYIVSRWEALSTRQSIVGVGLVGILYSGITVVTFIQAILGHPLVNSMIVPWLPPTLGAGILLFGSVCGTLWLAATWQRAKRPRKETATEIRYEV
jgi:hypothetical protein